MLALDPGLKPNYTIGLIQPGDALDANLTHMITELFQNATASNSPDVLRDWIENEDHRSWMVEALTLESPSFGEPCFFDCEHKNLALLQECIKNFVLLRLATLFTRVEPGERNTELEELIDKRYNQAFGNLKTWLRYGEEVVDFSINTRPRFLEDVSIRGLERIYGKEELTRCMNLSTEALYVDKTRAVELLRADGKGQCSGMTNDFNASFLRMRKEHPELSCLEVAKKIAPTFRGGASKQAELAQIVQMLAQPKSGKPFTGTATDWFVDHGLLWRQMLAELDAQVFNLIIEEVTSSSVDPADRQIAEYAGELQEGVHYVFIHWKEGGGHAISFIKTGEEKDLIFDPNRGLFAVDAQESNTKLRKMIRDIEQHVGGKDTKLVVAVRYTC